MASTVIWTSTESAENYAAARPDYPPEVVTKSLNFLKEKYEGPLKFALDIGCGTGKSTEHLIDHFDEVVGCDPSEAMLEEARKIYGKRGNVRFTCASAEDLSEFPDNSMQLILASRCIHYFDADKFFKEARRLLVPNGVLVYYTLQFEEVHEPGKIDGELSSKLTAAYDEYLEGWIGKDWAQPKNLPEGFRFAARNRREYYREILQPQDFVEKTFDGFKIQRRISLATLRSLLDTYSASHTSRKVNGDEYTDKHRDASIAKIKDILGKPEVPDQEVQVDVTNEFIMVMHRQKSSK